MKKNITLALRVLIVIILLLLFYKTFFSTTLLTPLTSAPQVQPLENNEKKIDRPECPSKLYLNYLIETKGTGEVTDDTVLISARNAEQNRVFDLTISINSIIQGHLTLTGDQRAVLASSTLTDWWRGEPSSKQNFTLSVTVPGCTNINYGFDDQELRSERNKKVGYTGSRGGDAVYVITISEEHPQTD